MVIAGLAAFAATVGGCLPGPFMRTSADGLTWSDPAKIPLAEPVKMLRNQAVVRLAGEAGTLHRVDPDVGEVAPGEYRMYFAEAVEARGPCSLKSARRTAR